MTESDLPAFSTAWRQAGAMYGQRWTPGSETIALAFLALRPYALSEVTAALSVHVRDPDRGQFAPKPADIVRQLELNTESRAMLAWDKVRGAVQRIGQYTGVCFDDPLIHIVVDAMGGWVRMAEMETDDAPFIAKDFQKRYQLFAARPPAEYPRILLGVCGENQVTFVGNEEAAKRVYALGADRKAITAKPLSELLGKLAERPALEIKHAA